MNIIQVNKPEYRSRLNKVIVAFILLFALLAITFGAVFISLFAEPIVDPETQSNFKYNLLGVIVALLTMSMIMNTLKRHTYLQDIYYVWQLKQLHNRIYRKLKKIKRRALEDDASALIILAFYYKSLKQVYELDDNTLTINVVVQEIEQLKAQLGDNDFDKEADKFDEKLLASY